MLLDNHMHGDFNATHVSYQSVITTHIYSVDDIIENGWWDLENSIKDSLYTARAFSLLLNQIIPQLPVRPDVMASLATHWDFINW